MKEEEILNDWLNNQEKKLSEKIDSESFQKIERLSTEERFLLVVKNQRDAELCEIKKIKELFKNNHQKVEAKSDALKEKIIQVEENLELFNSKINELEEKTLSNQNTSEKKLENKIVALEEKMQKIKLKLLQSASVVVGIFFLYSFFTSNLFVWCIRGLPSVFEVLSSMFK